MNRVGRVGVLGGVAIMLASLSGCVAPSAEVIGALGVGVDEQARPVLIVEACDGAAVLVDLALDRQGLADDEENQAVGEWTAAPAVQGTSRVALHAPAAPWEGAAVEVALDRGYVAGGQGEQDGQVLTQVAFQGSDLAGLEPGLVYRNDPEQLANPDADPGDSALLASTPSEFTAEVCNRE